jgi:hypothetical protein
MGAFYSFGRSLNAIFEKRAPWPIHNVSGTLARRRFGETYNVLLVRCY